MAGTTDAEKLPLSSCLVKDRQRKVWSVFEMLDVVDKKGGAVTSPGPAELALVVVHGQYNIPGPVPLRPVIKPVCGPICQHGLKLKQAVFRDHGRLLPEKQKRLRQHARISRSCGTGT